MNGAAQLTADVFPIEAYEIRGQVGTGQFGVVHRAWDARRGAEVALKHIRAEGADGGIKVQAEERGAALQRRFASRYAGLVPELYECGRAANGDYYIAMELIDGRPLTELIRTARIESRRAAELGVAIADFLVKLHGLSDGEEPILHSDLKPEHVLVREDGSLRILDLGIAKSLQANKSLTGNAWASAPYASPERLDDGLVRAGDDYWALGVMLFEMVAGYHPYHIYMSGDNNATLARAIRRMEPPAPLPTLCEPGLGAVIRKMLAPQAAHRYQTAAEIADDLRNYLAGRETVAAAESARASQRTQIIPQAETTRPPAMMPDTVPTDPVPAAALPARPVVARRRRGPIGLFAAMLTLVYTVVSRVARLPLLVIRVPWLVARAPKWLLAGTGKGAVALRVALAALFVMTVLTEGAAWIRAEKFRQRIGGLQPSDAPAIRAELANMRNMSMLGVGAAHVREPLRDHLVGLADRAILDFRNDLLVTEVQWGQARRSLELAAEIAPNDRDVAARLRYVEGHLARISAQGQTSAVRQARLNDARSLFIDAARLDSRWPDPFLGLARVNAYDTRDFEALQVNITELERRGYTPGRREEAQLGDAHKFKAERALMQSRSASGEGRRRFLEQAATDYEACVTKFEALDNYRDSERNLAFCRRQLARVRDDLQSLEGLLPFLFGVLDADRRR